MVVERKEEKKKRKGKLIIELRSRLSIDCRLVTYLDWNGINELNWIELNNITSIYITSIYVISNNVKKSYYI